MATSYKTPGVYIEEISKFPPSVAQVETAIPAFIGYTVKATKLVNGDLNLKPTRISSLVEYLNYFGSAKPETTIGITVTDTFTDGANEREIIVSPPSSKSPFLMFYAMQMYFANGGGPCYIVSVKSYADAISDNSASPVQLSDLQAGLAKVELEDEPTLIVFPDATSLGEADFYAVNNDALLQCNKLQDRFAIIDTYSDDENAVPAPVAGIREGINLEKDYLKYGAVYYPFLETILNFEYDAAKLMITHTATIPTAVSGAVVLLDEYKEAFVNISNDLRDTGDAAKGYIGEAKAKISADFADFPGTSLTDLKSGATELAEQVKKVIKALKETDANRKLVNNTGMAVMASVDENLGDHDADPGTPDTNPTAEAINTQLTALNNIFEGTDKIEKVIENLNLAVENLTSANSKTKIENNVTTISDELNKIYEAPTDVLTDAAGILDNIKSAVQASDSIDTNNGELNGRSLAGIEKLDNEAYSIIKTKIADLPMTLPPSAAMAGVYARVDEDRGVWKAPANVGLNYVMRPSVKITSEDQESLNVDTVAGKSVNAIRAFTGKGTLVWGARTLAGNDNEWRYISVRRFFNMVEESVKKASAQFVFEPNDANTWVKVRAMIENFLILQWRAGALTGAKQEQAFYVRVGLGQTMTADDILRGYMNVEIGMAVVRPAEFIVLKFSHKMQEA
ncbi:phage tail sheath C-terminal domain-containing protein [Saccharicrinis sp. FJH54]|uniref:phage tail sheath C-terminal domain-containing protein n=1 Tax=Saccharicrinis sp. FJH54 TaxID=3344665 RepID=UPI0035D4F060